MTSKGVHVFDTTYPQGSDEWWLRMLHASLNARPPVHRSNIRESRRRAFGRRDWMDLLWSYRTGEPPLASPDKQRRDDVREFLRLGRANYAGLSVQAMLDLITLTGIRTAGDADGDGDDAFRAILAGTGSWLSDALDFSFTMSEGFVMVGKGVDGPVITAEDPRNCVVFTDPLDPLNVTAALKVYTDEITGKDHAHLFIGARGEERVRVATRGRTGGWEWDDERSGPLPFQGHGLPIVPLPNKLGLGEFEPHLDVLDRINNMISDRLWVTKIQAFRQRALVPEKEAPQIPSIDPETGGKVDLGQLFEASPDALWKMPPGWKIWESTPLDIGPILQATKDDVREFSAVSGTPLSMTSSDSINQSGQGAKNTRSALTDKARDRMTRATPAIRRIARLALAAADKGDLANQPIEVMWAPIDVESLEQRGQAAVSAKNSDVPWEVIQSEIWKFSPDVIARAKKLRLVDLFQAALTEKPDGSPSA